MDYSIFSTSRTYVGTCTKIIYGTWEIMFKCDALGANTEIPATPAFNHTVEIHENDDVLIFQPDIVASDCFFYWPITLNEFVGLQFIGNMIEMTKRGEINMHADKQIVLSAGGTDFESAPSKVEIMGSGAIYIRGTLHVTGEITSGEGGSFAMKDPTSSAGHKMIRGSVKH